jgi:hypothetical protein
MPVQIFRIWRGERGQGRLEDYHTEVSEGMVVLHAGSRSGVPLELQGR